MDDQAEWSGWSETVGVGDVQVPCPVPDCGREVTEQVTVMAPCPVHSLAASTPEQRAALERAAVEAFLLGPDPDEERDFPE